MVVNSGHLSLGIHMKTTRKIKHQGVVISADMVTDDLITPYLIPRKKDRIAQRIFGDPITTPPCITRIRDNRRFRLTALSIRTENVKNNYSVIKGEYKFDYHFQPDK